MFIRYEILIIRYEYVNMYSVIRMEKRNAKIIVGKACGTAGTMLIKNINKYVFE